MFLFIASEVMLFGSFFTAYFFVRVVNDPRLAAARFHLPVYVAGDQHRDPRHVELHDALGAEVDQARNRAGLKAGLVLTFLMGFTFLRRRSPSTRGSASQPGDDAFTTIFLPDGPPRSARLRRPSILLLIGDPGIQRALTPVT